VKPEEALHLAKYQRPGVKLVVGATDAYELPISRLPIFDLMQLPGESNWPDYWLRRRLGYLPSLWARCFGADAEYLGHSVTDKEYAWLNGTAGLIEARHWLCTIAAQETTT
jgi:hypothetical protein